jgi:Trk K+ transport system NAD-binding subunit
LSAQVGHDLITVPVPEALAGRPFFDVFCDLKRDHGMIAMAILAPGDGARVAGVVTNPAGDIIVKRDDRLVVVSAGERQTS